MIFKLRTVYGEKWSANSELNSEERHLKNVKQSRKPARLHIDHWTSVRITIRHFADEISRFIETDFVNLTQTLRCTADTHF